MRKFFLCVFYQRKRAHDKFLSQHSLNKSSGHIQETRHLLPIKQHTHSGLFLAVTLKYMGSTLCLIAWAFPTRASTEDTFSGSWRFSTTVLMAFITLRAWCRSWLLLSISSGSSMSWNWLKYCLADGKLTKNLRRQTHFRWL